MAAIYLLGDSHSQLLGPRLKTLLTKQGHTFRFESFSGQPTKLAHQKATIPSGQDVVVLSLGGNDRGDQTAARAALIAALKLRNPRARIVWFGPFDASAHEWAGRVHDEQAEAQRKHLPGLGVQWVDTRPYSKTNHQADKVHFTGTGYTAIAARMLPPIQNVAIAAAQGTNNAAEGEAGGGGFLLIAAAAGALWLLLRRPG